MKKLLFLALSASLFSACSGLFETTIKLDSPPFEKKLVVQMVANSSDSTQRISVQRNFGALEEPIDSLANVSGATVEWLENGLLLETFRLDSIGGRDTASGFPGSFFGPNFTFYGKNWQKPFIRAGAEYELRVSHPDFPSVSAKARAPKIVAIESAKVKIDTSTGSFSSDEAVFDIEFTDPAAEPNFYEIIVESADPDMAGNVYSLYWDDPNLQNGLAYQTALLNDEFLNGKKVRLRVKNGDYNSSAYRVILRSVTEDWYRFSTTARLNIETSFNPFANPVQVFSNVAGGLGIFSVASESSVVIEK